MFRGNVKKMFYFPPAVVRTRGTWHVCECLHIPPITAVSVAADTQANIIPDEIIWNLSYLSSDGHSQQHCVLQTESFGCRATLNKYSTKIFYNIKKYLIANVVAGEMTERD